MVSASRITDPAELSTILNGSVGPAREATVTSDSNTRALTTDAIETGSSRTATSASGAPQSAQVSSPTNESTVLNRSRRSITQLRGLDRRKGWHWCRHSSRRTHPSRGRVRILASQETHANDAAICDRRR